MRKTLIIFFLSLVLQIDSIAENNFCSFCRSIDYLPRTPSISEKVSGINIEKLSEGMRLCILSLQGIQNRDKAEIYTYVNQDEWLIQFYKDKLYIRNFIEYLDPFIMLENLFNSKEVSGLVVYDPDKKFTINLATNIAGVEDRIIVHPSDLDKVKDITDIEDVLDLRQFDFRNQAESFEWFINNIFPNQNHNILSVAKGGLLMFDVYRDYLIEFKIPVFWLPGKDDEDYDRIYENQVINLLSMTPSNIPVFGFWPGVENGKDIGYNELDGVKLAGNYAKFTIVNTWVGNYSFHSGVDTGITLFRQRKTEKKALTYEKDKKYVALIMAESGDAPAYYLYTGFYPRQWNDPDRGQVAISYGISPSLRMLVPAILDDLYCTKTNNDYFFCSISGSGYCYPFLGYANNTSDPGGTLYDYFVNITAPNMRILDIDMLGIYTHPDIGWTESDRRIAEKFILPMDGLRSIISGMHKTTYTAGNSHELFDNISLHHTVTFWSMRDLDWDDISIDEEAVDFLEKEIKNNGADGQFIQAMFYSWHYGPRRLRKLKERLEPEGYVFVTLDDFDFLWRKSLNIKD